MNGTRDTSETAAADEGGLDPREAAALLDQTTRQAQRRFETRPPLLMLLAAVAALAGPIDVWGVMGAGLCVLLLCRAAVQVSWEPRPTRLHGD
jgi:fatty acid desaturase